MAEYVPGQPFVPENTYDKVSGYGQQLNTAYQNALNARQRVLKERRTLEQNKRKLLKSIDLTGIRQDGPRNFFKKEHFDPLNKALSGEVSMTDDELFAKIQQAVDVYEALSKGYTDEIKDQRDELEALSLSSPDDRNRVGREGERFSLSFGEEEFETLDDAYNIGFKYGDDGEDNGLTFVKKDEETGMPIVRNKDDKEIIWGVQQSDFFGNMSYFDPTYLLEEYSEKGVYEYGEDDKKNGRFGESWDEKTAGDLFDNKLSLNSGTKTDRTFRIAVANADPDIMSELEKIKDIEVEIAPGNIIKMNGLDAFYGGYADHIPDPGGQNSLVNQLIAKAKEKYIEGTMFSASTSSGRPTAKDIEANNILNSGEAFSKTDVKITSDDKKQEGYSDLNEYSTEYYRYALGKTLSTQIEDLDISGTGIVDQAISFSNIGFAKDVDDEGAYALVVTLTRNQQVDIGGGLTTDDEESWNAAKERAITDGETTFRYKGETYSTEYDFNTTDEVVSISYKGTDTYIFPTGSKNLSKIRQEFKVKFGPKAWNRVVKKAKKQLGID